MRSPGNRLLLAELLQQELREIHDDFRFRIVAPLIAGLMLISALIGSLHLRGETAALREAVAGYTMKLEGITLAELASMEHPTFKPPWKLAIVAEGGQWRTPNVYRHILSFWTAPASENLGRLSPYRDGGPALDWAFFIKVVLSLSAFLLGYDSCCGERQQARLRLILSQPVSSWQVLLAKLAARWVALATPFVAGAVLSFVVIVAVSGHPPSASEYLRGLIGVVVGLGAAALFTATSLLISVSSSSPQRSLAAAVLVWITFVVMIPATGSTSAQLLRPLPTSQEVTQRLADIGPRVGTGGAVFRSRELAREEGYTHERRSAEKENLRHQLEGVVLRDVILSQLDQAAFARAVALTSLTSLIQDLLEHLLGTGLGRDRRFLQQAWAFEEVLAEHFRRVDYEDPDSGHIFFVPRYLSERPVVAEEVPRFEFSEATLTEGWQASLFHFALLGLWALALPAALALAWARRFR